MAKEVQMSEEVQATAHAQQALASPSAAVTPGTPDTGSSPKPAQGLDVLRAHLKEISALYAQDLPARMEALELAVATVHREQCSPESLDSLYRHVHKLSGSAATFGFPALTDAARRLEGLLRAIQQGTLGEGISVEESLQQALRDMQAAAREPQA